MQSQPSPEFQTLVLTHMDLVSEIARGYPRSIRWDMEGVGSLALVQAARRWIDKRHAGDFKSYAAATIYGEMRGALRELAARPSIPGSVEPEGREPSAADAAAANEIAGMGDAAMDAYLALPPELKKAVWFFMQPDRTAWRGRFPAFPDEATYRAKLAQALAIIREKCLGCGG